jgi:ABC-type lipoprotein release transport system permease subunit
MKLPSLADVRKALVAIVGVAALLVSAGVLHGTAETIANTILAVATAVGVYVTPNGAAAPITPTS